ncbi:histamine H2 receptor-like [Antedon mediterranea]|uniref:histamine H2 receptor-like n=1 Tax=Antedon mediterranea TaxID=105859 RepID=UPI003AF8D763
MNYNFTVFDDEHSTENIILAAVFIAIDMLTILGNSLFFLCLIILPPDDRDSNLLLMLLAVTDLTNGLLIMPPTIISTFMNRWVFGNMICTFQCSLNYCLIIISMLTLAMISCDRMIAVTRPMKYQLIVTRRRIKVAIFMSCLQGVVIGVAPGFKSWVVYDNSEKVCAIDWENSGIEGKYYVASAFLLCFLLPGGLMLINFIRIVQDLKSTTCKLSSTMRLQETKTIRSLGLVVALFFICLGPFSITKLIKIFSLESIPSLLNNITTIFHFMSSANNPLVYGILRREFRKAFKQLIGIRGSQIQDVEIQY